MKLKPAESVWWDEDESRPKCDSLSLFFILIREKYERIRVRLFFHSNRLKGRGGECFASCLIHLPLGDQSRTHVAIYTSFWHRIATSWLKSQVCCVHISSVREETSKLLFPVNNVAAIETISLVFFPLARQALWHLSLLVSLMHLLINWNQRQLRWGRLLFQLNSAHFFQWISYWNCCQWQCYSTLTPSCLLLHAA